MPAPSVASAMTKPLISKTLESAWFKAGGYLASRLLSNCLKNYFEPMTKNDVWLFHVGKDDQVIFCSPDLGQNYQQEISLATCTML